MKATNNSGELWRLLAGLVSIVALSGCANMDPVLTPQNTFTSQSSAEQVKTAIIEAGNMHINYNATGYRINYVESEKLHANNGKIHRDYNRLVNNLDHDI